ncbi:MAG: hypothetical protein ABSA65_11755 [Acidimicrobiales bacterium]|jgi:hypothetical protein
MNTFTEAFKTSFKAARDKAAQRETRPAPAPAKDGRDREQEMRTLRDLKTQAVHVAAVVEQKRGEALAVGDLDQALELSQTLCGLSDLIEEIDRGGTGRFGIAWTPHAG